MAFQTGSEPPMRGISGLTLFFYKYKRVFTLKFTVFIIFTNANYFS